MTDREVLVKALQDLLDVIEEHDIRDGSSWTDLDESRLDTALDIVYPIPKELK